LKANPESRNVFWLARVQREIPSEPQIRDVCAHCNNVVLSELDGYICTLFDAAFVRIPQRNERVAFEHDYHRLKRWLLKISFNSARIHRSADLFALEAVLPYIRGENDLVGESVRLFVQLSYPQEVPEADLAPHAGSERPIIFESTINRAGHVFFRVPGVGQKVLRAVHLRAFSFVLAFFHPGERRETMMDFERVFTQHRRSTVRLRPDQRRVELVCDGIGAWDSFRGSRENKLVSSDDV
jgi:hypothetical protein